MARSPAYFVFIIPSFTKSLRIKTVIQFFFSSKQIVKQNDLHFGITFGIGRAVKFMEISENVKRKSYARKTTSSNLKGF